MRTIHAEEKGNRVWIDIGTNVKEFLAKIPFHFDDLFNGNILKRGTVVDWNVLWVSSYLDESHINGNLAEPFWNYSSFIHNPELLNKKKKWSRKHTSVWAHWINI